MIFDAETLVEPNQKERRQFPRFGFNQPVSCGFTRLMGIEGALSADLSESGLRLTVNDFVPVGTELTVSVPISGKIIECQAQVVWVEQKRHSEWYQIGIEFLPSDSLRFSQKWIQDWAKHNIVN